MYRNVKVMLIIVSIIFGFAGYTPAQKSDVPAMPMMKHECAKQPGGHGMPYCLKGLSDEDVIKVQEKSRVYLEETDGLRKDIQTKKDALKEELAKKDPDKKVAIKLQKELSKLENELDVKRIEHFLEVKKMNPDIRFKFQGECICKKESKEGSACPMKSDQMNPEMMKEMKMEHKCPYKEGMSKDMKDMIKE